jgi:hypothetical protein
MRQIQLTRRAIKDLQSLQSSGSVKIPQRLFEVLANSLPGEKFPYSKHMSGYRDLWISRIDTGGGSSMRLIWTENKNDRSIKFLYAGLRDESTYDKDTLNNLPRDPAYQWNGETGVEWSLFLNGGYNASPVLTQDQRKTSEKIGLDNPHTIYGEDRRVGFFAHITQSPPGTGKTIVAALRACELYNIGWNVTFIVPEHLLIEVKSFRCIQSIPLERKNSFFYGTFKNWIDIFFPEKVTPSCSPEEERKILENLAKRAATSGRNIKFGDISIRDTILFQLFALNADSDNSKSTVFTENRDRIQALKNIKKEWWQEELKNINKSSRSEFAESIREESESKFNNYVNDWESIGSIFIIDESQDYLLSEIEIFKTICRKLHKSGHLTQLWLLGDLNQRIIPVDFDWGALQLSGYEETDWKCFRNSKNILKFSNLFLDPVVKNARVHGTRYPCNTSDPEKSYEEGERVKLICYPSISDAEVFLDRLSNWLVKDKQNDIEKSQSLIYKLASRVKILKSESYKPKRTDILEFLDVSEAKGREFDACIVFNIFSYAEKSPTSEDWWKWYTLLTRNRSRLLVIVTQEQYKLLYTHIPQIELECEYINSQDIDSNECIFEWINSTNNDLDFSVNYRHSIENLLYSGLELKDPLIYWDTYEVLETFKITGFERSDLEKELLSRLKNHDFQVLESKLNLSKLQTKNPLISCLILRAMGRY